MRYKCRMLFVALLVLITVFGCASTGSTKDIQQAPYTAEYETVGYRFVYTTTEEGDLKINFIDFFSDAECEKGIELATSLLPKGSTGSITGPGEVTIELAKALDEASFNAFVDTMNANIKNYF